MTVTPRIRRYTVCYPSSSSVTNNNYTSSNSSSNASIGMFLAQNFGQCRYSENSLFQQIFGNTVKCRDYHDNKHRIQTKVWNEHYLLWSTVGAQAKYQKKRTIGWSESATASKVMLGINHVTYKYKTPFSPYNAHDPKRVIIKYKGVSYDLSGKVIQSYPISPTKWPFPQNETIAELDVTIFGNEIYYPLSGKHANKSINQILSAIRSNFKNIVPDIDTKMRQDEMGVNITKFLTNEIKVTRADILKEHKSRANIKFDFNFLLTLSNSSSADFDSLTDQFKSEKYDELDIDVYGAALRNGVWKGKKITGSSD